MVDGSSFKKVPFLTELYPYDKQISYESLVFLLTIPILAVLIYLLIILLNKTNINGFLLLGIINLIIILLLGYLYINNIIGLPDFILLSLIFLFGLNPMLDLTVFLNILLIPLAIVLSFNNKN